MIYTLSLNVWLIKRCKKGAHLKQAMIWVAWSTYIHNRTKVPWNRKPVSYQWTTLNPFKFCFSLRDSKLKLINLNQGKHCSSGVLQGADSLNCIEIFTSVLSVSTKAVKKQTFKNFFWVMKSQEQNLKPIFLARLVLKSC